MRTFLACAILLQIGIVASHAQPNLFLVISPPGDYIAQGTNYESTNAPDITISGGASDVLLSASTFSIEFASPSGTNLTPGFYTNIVLAPSSGSSPGLTISDAGRTCSPGCGDFQVFELGTNSNGNVVHFWATFSQKCQCGQAPLTGEVRYQSQLAPSNPLPRIINVPGDFPSIGAALSNASPVALDTIVVAPGTYNESISFQGKPARVSSQSGPAVTVISPASGTAGVIINQNETSNSILSGFTISGASQGVLIGGASPQINSNVITNCTTGVDCENCSPTIFNNLILACPGGGFFQNGTGIYSDFSSPLVLSNTILGCGQDGIFIGGASAAQIIGNVTASNGYYGIQMWAAGQPMIRNNIVKQNMQDGMNLVNQSDAQIIQNLVISNSGNGINWLVPSGASGPYAANNTIAYNLGVGLWARGVSGNGFIINNILVGTPALRAEGYNSTVMPVIEYNDAFSPTGSGAVAGQITNIAGISNNIMLDPMFTCAASNAFHLLAPSPCVDSGMNGALYLSATDLAGRPRILPGTTNANPIIDMGAFEFDPTAPPDPCLYLVCPADYSVVAPAGETSAAITFHSPNVPAFATVSFSPPNGSSLPGGTNLVTCTASFGGDTDTCSFAVIVYVPPVITNQPAVVNVAAGLPFSLSVSAVGTPPFNYSWACNGTNISGATSSSLTIADAQASTGGTYVAIVNNQYGVGSNAVATVNVLPASPTISSNPTSVTATAGGRAMFSGSAYGSEPISYQWYFNNSPLVGATSATLVLPDIQAANAGPYYLLASNAYGSMSTSTTVLTVNPALPSITAQPTNFTAFRFQNIALSVMASGTEPMFYQWQVNSTNLAGATNSVLALNGVQPSSAGNYSVIISNSLGVVTSPNALLTVLPVAIWGNGFTEPGLPVSLSNAIAISAGAANGLALRSDGSVVGFGNNEFGLTNVPLSLTNPIALASCYLHNMVLDGDGRIGASWGFNELGLTNIPAGLSNIVALAAGQFHNIALRSDGTVFCWGQNSSGQTNVPAGLSNVVAVAAGYQHSLALKADGTVVAWGNNASQQTNVPSGLNNVMAIAGTGSSSLALKSNGVVVAWGSNVNGETNVPPGLSNVVAIAGGDVHCLALKSDGTVSVWGQGGQGQTNIPVGLTNVIAIAAGYYHNLALIGDAPLPQQFSLFSPRRNSGSFSVSVPSSIGRVYRLQYKNQFTDSNWTSLPLAAGNGQLLIVADPTATNSQRVYRVQRW